MAAAGVRSAPPRLLASGRLEPRKVVGSIDTAEFVVAVGASLGFLLALGSSGINLAWAGALLAGGVLAAPIAAYLVRHLPARVLGTAAGGLIIVTNAKTVLESSWIGFGEGLDRPCGRSSASWPWPGSR